MSLGTMGVATRHEAFEALPDYGLDTVLREEVGLTLPPDFQDVEQAINASGLIALDALRHVDKTCPERPFVFWPSNHIWMVRSDDELAKEALQAAEAGAGIVMQGHPSFAIDTVSVAGELIRAKRSDQLGYDRKYSHVWAAENPLANSVLRAVHIVKRYRTQYEQPTPSGEVHPALRATAHMYKVD